MKTAYFTFGMGHVHVVDGVTYDKDVLVKITAEDPRKVMFDTFGAKWANQYEELIDPIYYPKGIKELP